LYCELGKETIAKVSTGAKAFNFLRHTLVTMAFDRTARCVYHVNAGSRRGMNSWYERRLRG
jgi:hypothetical protein